MIIDWRVFENRVLKSIFGSQMQEVTGGCRKLHNEDSCNMYSSPNITRVLCSSYPVSYATYFQN
jgi:hypothetical protein